jgi:anti-anti-sigma factor
VTCSPNLLGAVLVIEKSGEAMGVSSVGPGGDSGTVTLRLVGELQGGVARRLALTAVEVLVVDRPDVLVIDLGAVCSIGPVGVEVLVLGYAVAIEHGTVYRVVDAHGQVRRVLESAGVLDVLADSEDVGSLVLALLLDSPGSGP